MPPQVAKVEIWEELLFILKTHQVQLGNKIFLKKLNRSLEHHLKVLKKSLKKWILMEMELFHKLNSEMQLESLILESYQEKLIRL